MNAPARFSPFRGCINSFIRLFWTFGAAAANPVRQIVAALSPSVRPCRRVLGCRGTFPRPDRSGASCGRLCGAVGALFIIVQVKYRHLPFNLFCGALSCQVTPPCVALLYVKCYLYNLIPVLYRLP